MPDRRILPRALFPMLAACALLAFAGCSRSTAPLVPDVRMTAEVAGVSREGVTIHLAIRNVSLVPVQHWDSGPGVEFLDAAGNVVPWRDPHQVFIQMPCGPRSLAGRATLEARPVFPATFFDPQGNPYPAPEGRYTAVLKFGWWVQSAFTDQRMIEVRVPIDWSVPPVKS